jgi:ankyrin repeat protein
LTLHIIKIDIHSVEKLSELVANHSELLSLQSTVGVKSTSTNQTQLSLPLHAAVSAGSVDTLKQLLEKNEVDIHAVDKRGITALGVAVIKGDLEACKLLIEAGTELHNFRDSRGQSYLHIATLQSKKDVVALLLDKGVSVDVTNAYSGMSSVLKCHL